MAHVLADVLDALEDLNYDDVSELELVAACDQGTKSPQFTGIVSWLTTQLQKFYKIEEAVNETKDPKDSENFLYEISGFLKEYGCPYKSLTTGDLTRRLQTKEDCLYLLLFLTSEVQAARIHQFNNPQSQSTPIVGNSVFQNVKSIGISLNMSKPPDNISVQNLFVGLLKKLNEAVSKCPKELFSTPVITQNFGPKHWEELNGINKCLKAEYQTRKAMLLKRLDVTILSFNWSERAKKNIDNVANAYQSKRHSLDTETIVDISDLLAAREDITNFHKTSSEDTRFECNINKIKMGTVPDRGGRTEEIRAPAPEMPSWQKRQEPPQQQRQGGRGRGDYRGNKSRDFHNSNQRPASAQNYNENQNSGGRGNRGRPQSGRGGAGGGKWGRGRGGYRGNRGGGAFEQAFQSDRQY